MKGIHEIAADPDFVQFTASLSKPVALQTSRRLSLVADKLDPMRKRGNCLFFLTGSASREDATLASDIDIVCIIDDSTCRQEFADILVNIADQFPFISFNIYNIGEILTISDLHVFYQILFAQYIYSDFNSKYSLNQIRNKAIGSLSIAKIRSLRASELQDFCQNCRDPNLRSNNAVHGQSGTLEFQHLHLISAKMAIEQNRSALDYEPLSASLLRIHRYLLTMRRLHALNTGVNPVSYTACIQSTVYTSEGWFLHSNIREALSAYKSECKSARSDLMWRWNRIQNQSAT